MPMSYEEALVLSNVGVFYKIARESYEVMKAHLIEGRRPKPNKEPGWIVTYDPAQKGFKAALVTIMFCGVFLEAFLHLLMGNRLGIDVTEKKDREPYEKKLRILGCDDSVILTACKEFREARNGVVHEKAHLDDGKVRVAQTEASSAIGLVEDVLTYFGYPRGFTGGV